MRFVVEIFHKPMIFFANRVNLLFPHVLSRFKQIVILLNFFNLSFKLLIFLSNSIKFFVLLNENVVKFLYFLSNDSEVLLVLEDLQIFLVRELNFMMVFLQLEGLFSHLIFKVSNYFLVFNCLSLHGLIFKFLVD